MSAAWVLLAVEPSGDLSFCAFFPDTEVLEPFPFQKSLPKNVKQKPPRQQGGGFVDAWR